MERHSRNELNQTEIDDLAALIERGGQLMLRKAEAVAILKQRGVAESPDSLMTPHA
jgi:hypothetical protein